MDLTAWRAQYAAIFGPHLNPANPFSYPMDALIGISVPGNWAGWQINLRDTKAIEKLLVEQDARGKDLYFRVPPLRNRVYGPTERGYAEDSLEVPALFLDLDIVETEEEQAAHKPFRGKQAGLRHPYMDEVLAMLDEVLPASLVVASGHGAHAYFTNLTPFALEIGTNGKKDDRGEHAQFLVRWDAFWMEECRKRGFGMDGGISRDAARVLRVAGSHNRKIDGDHRPVTIVTVNPDAAYNTATLDAFIPEPPKQEAKPRPATHAIKPGDRKKGGTWSTKVPVSFLMEEFFGMEVTSDRGSNRRWAFPHEDGSITPGTDHCTTFLVGEKQELELAYALGSRLQEAWGVDDHHSSVSSWDLLVLLLGGDLELARMIAGAFNEPDDDLVESISNARAYLIAEAAAA